MNNIKIDLFCNRQRVYGVTTALVKVGYEYAECKDVIWDVQTTKLSGHDMSISEVGGWNLLNKKFKKLH
jgi:hypothetical protein